MTVNTVSEVQTTQKEPERERLTFTFKATQVLWLLLSIFEALLALRFVSKLIRPNRPARLPRFFMFSPAFYGCGFSSFDRDTRLLQMHITSPGQAPWVEVVIESSCTRDHNYANACDHAHHLAKGLV